MKAIFVTREDNSMPAVRIRCHDFANYLKKSGVDSEVFSYAEELGAKSGKEEKNMNWLKKCAYNFKAYRRLSSENTIFVLQRFNYHSFAPLFLKLFKNNKLVFDLDDWEAREDIDYFLEMILLENLLNVIYQIVNRHRDQFLLIVIPILLKL